MRRRMKPHALSAYAPVTLLIVVQVSLPRAAKAASVAMSPVPSDLRSAAVETFQVFQKGPVNLGSCCTLARANSRLREDRRMTQVARWVRRERATSGYEK